MSAETTTDELLEQLRQSRGPEARRILYALARRPVVLPTSDLLAHLEEGDEALDCALKSDALALVEPCARLLGREWKAALVLARLGQRQYTDAIVAQLAESSGVAAQGYAMALEVMGDAACVPALLALADQARPALAFVLHHALVALTGRRPLIAWVTSEWPVAMATAWRRPALAAPALVGVRETSPREVAFAVDHGRARIRVEYDAFAAGAWPRWDRSLTVAGQPLYRVSSHCGTCRTILHRTGALGLDAASSALEAHRGLVAAMDHVDSAALEVLWPLLRELDTGHYLASLVDLPLERVELPARSWLASRGATEEELAREGDELAHYWAGVAHHQSRLSLRPSLREAMVIVPSQDPACLDEARIEAWRQAIDAGERPAVVALAWVEDRSEAFSDEGRVDRTAIGVVLDGHHKLEAYARARVPARVLLVVHLEQCSTDVPAEDALRSVVAAVGACPAGPVQLVCEAAPTIEKS
ncbi:MAG: hypothetical protein JNL79_37700 [Myxococcales bacterium]|nr:hypothetical protein [Myxococcales bacterium]